eukprot:TRINITY_DN72836_c0_g1_i1.p1 TRINITY_DN72836_c0_g1~~TRINITY_DN72836_c0_g1_i1.p1  ORF type:complete len:321 (+),score=36.55 TRINITY_DN72836_c0_g1_i1:123-965(+)
MTTQAPSSVSHHDSARSQVSATALGVCALRALESRKPETERIIFDPQAEVLCGDEMFNFEWLQSTGKSKEFWIDFLSVRTRWIDDVITTLRPTQLVILGAGLDSRAYRLAALRGVPVYEVDFPEVLQAKQTLLAADAPIAQLGHVAANLGTDDWASRLVASGFQPDSSSVWLLEGLTGYLTEPELELLLQNVSRLAAAGSKMVATFVGLDMQQQATSMHRYMIKEGAQARKLLQSHGWSSEVAQLDTVAQQYGRAENIPVAYPYFLVSATRGAVIPASDL